MFKPGIFLFLFSFFSHDKYSTNTINEKSIDGMLGTQTRSGRMVGADETTELWWHPNVLVRVYILYKSLPVFGLEPRFSGVGSDPSTN